MVQFITKLINIFFFPFTKPLECVKISLKRRALRRRNKGVIYTMSLTKSDVIELVESIVRKAVSEQARDLEKHLQDIDRRLRELEKNK